LLVIRFRIHRSKAYLLSTRQFRRYQPRRNTSQSRNAKTRHENVGTVHPCVDAEKRTGEKNIGTTQGQARQGSHSQAHRANVMANWPRTSTYDGRTSSKIKKTHVFVLPLTNIAQCRSTGNPYRVNLASHSVRQPRLALCTLNRLVQPIASCPTLYTQSP
jgi:hypothetical protein